MGMAGRVSPLVRGLCFALLALCSCRGTERVLFDEITPTVVDRPVELRDASMPPPEEAGAGGGSGGPVIDPALDAGLGPDPGLDPSIKFPWTETLPGKDTCREGLYIGRFSCKVQDDAPIGDLLVGGTGQIVFTLRGSEEEQVLTLLGGQLTDDGFPVFLSGAELSGSLDCLNDHRLTASAMGMSFALQSYETLLTGWLNTKSLVITGMFFVTNDAGTTWTCDFQANAAP